MSNSKSARWDQQGGDAEKLVNLFKLFKKQKVQLPLTPTLQNQARSKS